jgi:hypothetical protein
MKTRMLSAPHFLSNAFPNFETDCWEWHGTKHMAGYGSYRVNGKSFLAHRVSWMIFNGEMPEGLCVCHKCDNRKCINPNHLFVGTQGDNVRDMILKGRFNPGGNNEKRLTDTERFEIVEMRRAGHKQKVIAQKYRVSQPTISSVCSAARRAACDSDTA